MTQSNNASTDFIERQLQFLFNAGFPVDKVIERLEQAIPNMPQIATLKQVYQQTGKLTQALEAAKLFQNEPDFIQLLALTEQQNSLKGFEQYIEDRNDLLELLSLFKEKLLLSFSYSFLLLAIATLVSFMFSHYIFPNFVIIFEAADSKLPSFLQFYFHWTQFFLNPTLIGFILLVFLFYFNLQLKRSNPIQLMNHQLIIFKLPFFNPIKNYINNYKTLFFLQSLLLNEYGEQNSFEYLKKHHLLAQLQQYDNAIYNDIKHAKEATTLTQEVHYQIAQLKINGRLLLITTAKKISLFIFLLVFLYITNNIIAIYLSIFKIGSSI